MSYDDAWLAQQLQKPGYRVVGEPDTPAGVSLPETAFLGQVRRIALDLGYCCYHTHDSRRSEPGFVDIVLVDPCHPSPVYMWELKTATGKVTPAQQVWMDALDGRTITAGVWRPRDLGTMTDRLRRRV
jgi:hypothetical protein